MSEELIFPSEFIEENKKLVTTSEKPKKKGGPYSNAQRNTRRAEVYRLHFELGYSITRISGLMNINPNTIASDVNYLYRKLAIEQKNLDFDSWLLKQINRLEIQRTRLLEELAKVNTITDKLMIEKMLLEIDSRILQTATKINSILDQGFMNAVKAVNRYNDLHDKNANQFIVPYEIIQTSSKAQNKIWKIIKEDRENRRGRVRVPGTPLIRG